MSRAGSFCLLRTNLIDLSYEDTELFFFIQSWYSTINYRTCEFSVGNNIFLLKNLFESKIIYYYYINYKLLS